jgi:pimeloyl-ACP methyl ester carboxylesterase
MVRKIVYGAGALILVALAVILIAGIHFDRSRDELAKLYTTPNSQFISLGGASVHMRDEGNAQGPVLVLLHGSNSSLQTWEPWVKELGERFRIITMDLPGHGLTGSVPGDDYSRPAMVEFVHRLLQSRGIGKFALAGNSMGGGIAAAYAEKYGDQLTALVLIDAAGIPRDPKDKPLLAFRMIRWPGAGFVMRWFTPRSLIAKTLRQSFADPSKVTDAMVDRYVDLMLYDGNRAATLKRFSHPDDDQALATALPQIHVPTLILWGTEDRLIPVSYAKGFETGINGSKLIVYEHVGHIPMEEIPAQSAADTRNFLESATAAASMPGAPSQDVNSAPGQVTVPSLKGKGSVEVAPLGAQ